jgi:hypothetical protein
MIKYSFHSQLTIEEFKTPFQCNLSKDNRWVKLGELIPWDHLAVYYMKTMSSENGRSGVSPQTVIGAMIIKHKLKLSDVETIETNECPWGKSRGIFYISININPVLNVFIPNFQVPKYGLFKV